MFAGFGRGVGGGTGWGRNEGWVWGRVLGLEWLGAGVEGRWSAGLPLAYAFLFIVTTLPAVLSALLMITLITMTIVRYPYLNSTEYLFRCNLILDSPFLKNPLIILEK